VGHDRISRKDIRGSGKHCDLVILVQDFDLDLQETIPALEKNDLIRTLFQHGFGGKNINLVKDIKGHAKLVPLALPEIPGPVFLSL
jgi:hypothetical protein